MTSLGDKVRVKPLEWHGPDFEGEYWAASIAERYTIRAPTGNGYWLGGVGGYFQSVDKAKSAAEIHHQSCILSALDLSPTVVEEGEASPEVKALCKIHSDLLAARAGGAFIDPRGTAWEWSKAILTAAIKLGRLERSASPSIGRVTDSMVEAALRGWYPGWDTEDRPKATDGISRAKMRAALAATLVSHEETAGDTQGALAVRPLKWEPAGRYPFVAMSDYYDIGHQSGDGRYWVHHRIFGDLREGDGTIEHHLTLDAAKAAAQEDHERKILWQIVGSSDPDVAPPNVEHLHPLADREKSAALVSPPDNGEAATSVDQRAAMAETVRQITSMLEWGDVPLSAGEVKLVEHIKGMPSRMTQDFSQAKIGRWLGWVQGAACAKGWLLLDDCKRINAQFSPALQSHNEGRDGVGNDNDGREDSQP